MVDLPNGIYLISSGSSRNNFVGRPRSDPMSQTPQKVISLPPSPDADAPKWVIEKLPNGRYRLKALGAPTGIRGGLLWAYDDEVEDTEDAEVEEWHLRPYRSVSPGSASHYTIEWATGGAGWVRQSNEPYTQIAVAPLSGQGKEEELWTVVHIPMPSDESPGQLTPASESSGEESD
ncbi:hypothetical protein PHLCEN_2v4056 [Hermanssonia centrifuga]|uniref:Uncharacterized protein n=1 Tax=Hermanssonia centrifuga TaxID=98765 RepID=A0A2R6Q5H2_9APHY|nr:hypothetical protein PHLCEN_2v4056 [Hermanssonia centrifuga]